MSHIIPRFLIQWRAGKQRKIRLRSYFKATDPDVAHLTTPLGRLEQDGPKLFLLCDSCEARFSKWENIFRRRAFYPLVYHPDRQLLYGPWLYLFLMSVCWRVIAYTHRTGATLDYWHSTYESWRRVLLDGEGEGDGELHLLPIHPDNRASGSIDDLPDNWQEFLMNDVAMTFSQAELPIPILIIKVGSIIIVALSKRNPDPTEWHTCQVRSTVGVLGGCDTPVPWGIYTLLRGLSVAKQEHDESAAARKAVRSAA